MSVARLVWKTFCIAAVNTGFWYVSPGIDGAGTRQIAAETQPQSAGQPPPAHTHVHAAVPPSYASSHLPTRAWTDPTMIAKGKEIYTAKCVLCHGEKGDGKGPGSVGLPLKPADFTDAKMVADMPGNYMFWRVSEGGLVEPYKSMGSAMPPWKADLSIPDRWAVIAYIHTLSGHDGAHTPREHSGMGAGHAGH